MIINFINDNLSIFDDGMNVLNAGSGGAIYENVSGIVYHLDISDKFIRSLPNHVVASIEEMPFNNGLFKAVICVGSVINYCNALNALSEISRVMDNNSFLILEYERSSTGELIFSKDYNKACTIQVYSYNKQSNHRLWLYSDKYIDSVLKSLGLEIIKNNYYHTFSSICNRIIKKETLAGKLSKWDVIAFPIVKKLIAHNRIMLCYKQ